jgi:hypothetical protein
VPSSSILVKTPSHALKGTPTWQKPTKKDPRGVFDDRK